ncbi:MAG: sugar phosphate isomerase/epimerase [Pirellulaceae bacterium]
MTHFDSLDRRRFMMAGSTLLTAAATVKNVAASAVASDCSHRMSLGFSLYGMKDVETEQALQTLRKIGFDSVELCLVNGFPTEPGLLDRAARRQLRGALAKHNLCLRAMMENIPLSLNREKNKPTVERLKHAAELARDLSDGTPPLIETILGSGKWLEVRDMYAAEVRTWAAVAQREGIRLAIKPHRSNAMDTPEKALWLMQQVNSDHVGLGYDYSHFFGRGIDMDQSIRQLAPYTFFVHVKDTIIDDGKARFALPGSTGDIDYARLLKRLSEHGYTGDVCVEVSSQVWKQPDYDAVAAAKQSYQKMSAAFHIAGIERPA